MKAQLQRIGVECPVTHYDPRRPLLRHALVDIDTLERLVATLAERVERAERLGRSLHRHAGCEPAWCVLDGGPWHLEEFAPELCDSCKGRGAYESKDGYMDRCPFCNGTGRRQA